MNIEDKPKLFYVLENCRPELIDAVYDEVKESVICDMIENKESVRDLD